MPDLLHPIQFSDGIFTCVDCGLEIPADVGALGDDVVELGGAGVHFLPRMAYDGKPRKCLGAKRGKAVIVCPDCSGSGCEACGFTGLVSSDGEAVKAEQAKPTGKEKIELAPRRSEFEKQMTRASVQNFVNMREATRPQ